MCQQITMLALSWLPWKILFIFNYLIQLKNVLFLWLSYFKMIKLRIVYIVCIWFDILYIVSFRTISTSNRTKCLLINHIQFYLLYLIWIQSFKIIYRIPLNIRNIKIINIVRKSILKIIREFRKQNYFVFWLNNVRNIKFYWIFFTAIHYFKVSCIICYMSYCLISNRLSIKHLFCVVFIFWE